MLEKSTEKPIARLSKSAFIRGLQCEKSLYLDKKRPFLRGKIPELQKAKFKRGHKIGKLAHNLFPGGINAAPKSPRQFRLAVEKTAEYIKQGENVIYEAAFSENGINILLDILVKDNNAWKAIEVKSSKAISETYLWDATLQYYVISSAGIEMSDFQICHVNKDYIKNNEPDVKGYFKFESIIDEIKKRINVIPEKIKSLYEVIQLSSSPDIKIGLQCHRPYPCDFINHCWKKVPQDSVLSVFGIDEETRFELFHSGISLNNIIEGSIEIPEISKDHIRILVNGGFHFTKNIDEINNSTNHVFYKSISINPALPVYENTSPFDHIGFGFALSNMDGIITDFLSMPNEDPSENYLNELLSNTKDTDQIIVFDKEHEKQVLLNHLKRTDHNNASINKIIEKMYCLKTIFYSGVLLWPEMTKNYSPKEILTSLKSVNKVENSQVNSDLHAGQLYSEQLNNEIITQGTNIQSLLIDYLHSECINIKHLYNKLIEIYTT